MWAWVLLEPDLTDRLRDDAFYEFAWAANVAAGRGPMVSDGVTTSGVQLLWSLLLVPFAWLSPLMLPLLAPWLGMAFHVLTAWLVRGFSTDRVVGWSLALCFLGHPLLLREAQNGQETALAVFFTALLWRCRGTPERWFAPLSVLAVLARGDLFALVLTLSFCRHRNEQGRLRPWPSLVSPLLAFAVPIAIHLSLGGGWLPDSALPMSWLWHTNHELSGGGFCSQQWWFTRPVLLGGPYAMASTFGYGLLVFQLVRPWWPVALRVVPAMMVGVASTMGVHDLLTAGWAALLLALFPAVRRRRWPCELLSLALGLVAIVVVHWALRWYPRDYYLAPLVVGAFVAMARYGRWRSFLFLFAVVQIQDSWRVRPEPLAGQAEMLLAATHLDEVLPPGERVGCFNSGIVTFYSDVLAREGQAGGADGDAVPRGVVNLDGVVDHRAFAALQEGRLSAWLDQQGIRFLLDGPHQFSSDPAVEHACGMHFGAGFDAEHDLVEIARFVSLPKGLKSDSVGMRLYWRRGHGERPQPRVEPGELAHGRGDESEMQRYWGGIRAGESAIMTSADGSQTVLTTVETGTAVLLEMGIEDAKAGSLTFEPR